MCPTIQRNRKGSFEKGKGKGTTKTARKAKHEKARQVQWTQARRSVTIRHEEIWKGSDRRLGTDTRASQGTTRVKFQRERERERATEFNVAKVRKPLALAVSLVKARNWVEPFIENWKTDPRLTTKVKDGPFVFDVHNQDGEVEESTSDTGGIVLFQDRREERLTQACRQRHRDPQNWPRSIPRCEPGMHGWRSMKVSLQGLACGGNGRRENHRGE